MPPPSSGGVILLQALSVPIGFARRGAPREQFADRAAERLRGRRRGVARRRGRGRPQRAHRAQSVIEALRGCRARHRWGRRRLLRRPGAGRLRGRGSRRRACRSARRTSTRRLAAGARGHGHDASSVVNANPDDAQQPLRQRRRCASRLNNELDESPAWDAVNQTLLGVDAASGKTLWSWDLVRDPVNGRRSSAILGFAAAGEPALRCSSSSQAKLAVAPTLRFHQQWSPSVTEFGPAGLPALIEAVDRRRDQPLEEVGQDLGPATPRTSAPRRPRRGPARGTRRAARRSKFGAPSRVFTRRRAQERSSALPRRTRPRRFDYDPRAGPRTAVCCMSQLRHGRKPSTARSATRTGAPGSPSTAPRRGSEPPCSRPPRGVEHERSRSRRARPGRFRGRLDTIFDGAGRRRGAPVYSSVKAAELLPRLGRSPRWPSGMSARSSPCQTSITAWRRRERTRRRARAVYFQSKLLLRGRCTPRRGAAWMSPVR